MARPNKLRKRQDGRHCTNINGKTVYFSRDRAMAVKQYHRAMAEAHKDQSAFVGAPETINGLIVQWRLIHASDNAMWRSESLREHFGSIPLRKVDLDLLRHLLKKLEDSKKAARSIRDYVGTARSILRWGHEHGWLPVLPAMPRLPRPMRVERDIPGKDLAERIARVPEPARGLAWFLLLTGARPAEGRLLQWSQIDWDSSRCILAEHKTAKATGRARVIHLSAAARRLLAGKREESSDSVYVFVSRKGLPYSSSGFRWILKRRDITPYALRHTFAQIASETLLPQDLAALMGHDDVRTSQHYYAVRADRSNTLINAVAVPQPAPPRRRPAAGDRPRKKAGASGRSSAGRRAKPRK